MLKVIETLSTILWSIILLIVIAYVGRSYIDFDAYRYETEPFSSPVVHRVAVPPDRIWTSIDQDIRDSVAAAKTTALTVAERRLEGWHDQLMIRVDRDFLEWYFNYFNQQLVGLSYAYHSAYDFIVGSAQNPSEKVIENIQTQFANRVLRPQVAQLELEALTKSVVQTFIIDLSHRLAEIPVRYEMPREEWDRHLESIAVMASTVEGDRTVPLTLKALTTGAGVTSGAMIAKAFSPVVKSAASKAASVMSAKLVSSAAAATATTAGAKVAGSTAGGFLGPLIAVGIITWDLYDHARTVDENRPIMRENIADYLTQFEQAMLAADGSVGGVLHNIELAIYEGLTRRARL